LKRFLVAACFVVALAAPGLAAAGPTIVSLTFDDGTAGQYAARSMLAQYSLHGTFFINSNAVGTSGHMDWSQLSDLAADGNEIGGHTLDHVALTSVSSAEATRQVCDDRQALISHGFTVTDFAYPSGEYNTQVESIVQGCGYSAARRSWGLCPIGQSPPNCDVWYPDVAETIPPQDRWATRTIPSIRAWHTLADLQSVVTRAEAAGGGWVPITLHHVCDGCDPDGYSTSPSTLSAFIAWLASRASAGTYVRTMQDIVSDATPPVSSIACDNTVCSDSSYGGPVSVTLSATDAASGVAAIRYTTDGSTPTTSSTTYTGPFAVTTTTSINYRAWDVAGNVEATKTQLIQVDTVAPTVTITSPANGAIVSGNVKIVAAANDLETGVASVTFYVDGQPLGTTNKAPWQLPWNTKRSTKGTHVLWAVATDRAGNAQQSVSVTVTVR
jgi:peptidoglycan/xylan/chitin deacetylase (PgdA/CDA1 family)